MGRQEQETAMYDQPTLPGLEPKVSKKHKKKRKALRDMSYQTTQHAQAVMRHEMERGVHKPQPIGEVLTHELGPQNADEDVRDEALMLIHEHGDGLHLSLGQWAIVQRLVEAGIISGRAGS